jgi:hypothetical protein
MSDTKTKSKTKGDDEIALIVPDPLLPVCRMQVQEQPRNQWQSFDRLTGLWDKIKMHRIDLKATKTSSQESM